MTGDSIIGIHHVQLAMPAGGEEVARHFYSGLLGISEVLKPAELAKRGGVWFETERIRIHLGIEKDFRPAQKAQSWPARERLAVIVKAIGGSRI
jgi:hypothetical protein